MTPPEGTLFVVTRVRVRVVDAPTISLELLREHSKEVE